MKRRLLRFLSALLLTGLLLALCCPPAFANGPGPMPPNAPRRLVVNADGLPEGKAGMDFLVPKDEIPQEDYTEQNEDVLSAMGLDADCALLSLEEDGYVSYALHYKKGMFAGWLQAQKGETQSFYYDTAHGEDNPLILLAENFSGYRIVVFDGAGEIFSISDPTKPSWWTGKESVALQYRIKSGSVTQGEKGALDRFFSLQLDLIAMLIACLLTVGLETLIALPFGLKPLSFVALVNLISNLLFNFLLYFSGKALSVPYLPALIFLEALVCVAEYEIYRRRWPEKGRGRLAAYTLLSNLVSCLAVSIVMPALL